MGAQEPFSDDPGQGDLEEEEKSSSRGDSRKGQTLEIEDESAMSTSSKIAAPEVPDPRENVEEK